MRNNSKKIFALVCASVLSISSIPYTVMAYTMPSILRVGMETVVKNSTSAKIDGQQILIGVEQNGAFIKSGELTSRDGFTAMVEVQNFIGIDETMSQSQAQKMVEDFNRLGLTSYIAFLGVDEWSVYISNSSISEVEGISGESAKKISNFQGYTLEGSENKIVIPKEANCIFKGVGTEDTFSIKGKPYRGYLSFAVNGHVMTAVNIIEVDKYLYGVVPSEMPQSYHKEALKAQAVAARTYVMTKAGVHEKVGYQVCDTIHCQVYKGFSGEAKSTTQGVNDTHGEIATYDGKPIEAVFSASSGGYTENNENVWNAEVPYLKAVPEIGVEENIAWKREFTISEMQNIVRARGDTIGTIEDIVITKLSTGGRIQEMELIGSSGKKVLEKENIRTYFSVSSEGSLPSKMFTINGKGGDIGIDDREPEEEPSQTSSLAQAAAKGIVIKTEGELKELNGKTLHVDMGETKKISKSPVEKNESYEVYEVSISTIDGKGKFSFEGMGNGHGVGLSQKGAEAMAKMGHTYIEILEHYYTGITIES